MCLFEQYFHVKYRLLSTIVFFITTALVFIISVQANIMIYMLFLFRINNDTVDITSYAEIDRA